MSSSDDPKKPEPRRTVAWNPDDLPGPGGDAGPEDASDAEEDAGPAGESAPAGESRPGAPEGPEPDDEGTVVISPEMVEELRAQAGEDEAEEDEEDPLVGQLIRDKWRVLSRLGAGSFGTVYKVRDEAGGWIEALKILGVDRITGSEAETVRKRFLREAQIMKRLGTQSQHIVGLSTYEEDLESGLIYFLMEFVEGKPLADVLEDDGPFEVDRVVRLALQVCEGLIVAHEGPDGVVHRDLKLENIMLTEDRAGQEMAKILDFGIAKLAERGEADSRLTTVGTLGTPGYAAPEQLRAEDVDARTDLFAFGVILYSLLTGKDPWLGNPAAQPTHQIYELMVATERGDVTPMAKAGREVPPAMEQVVMKLLRRDAAERYQSARELKEALQRVAAGGAASDVASLRVATDEPGVTVEVRSGRQVVAEGPTPLVANGLEPGGYKVAVRDERFERVETSLELTAGAMEDLTLVTTPREAGLAAGARRRPGVLVAAVLAVVVVAGAVLLQPWGRTLDAEALEARAGDVQWVQVTEDGLEGQMAVMGMPAPFRTPLAPEQVPATVSRLRASGVQVDASWEVARLVDEAARAQARLRYFGGAEDDVESLARRAAALAPESPEPRALLRKVAERMAWDAEAAMEDGNPQEAASLLEECLTLVPEHPRCQALSDR